MRDRLLASFQTHYGRPPEVVARAPGRIEFIGNHTDYNGGTGMGAAIDRGVWVAAAARNDGRRRFVSGSGHGMVEQLGELRRTEGRDFWVNYPTGAVAALTEFGLPVPAGFDLAVESDLPAGAGLSSSAAIELASAWALLGLVGGRRDPLELVKVARWAENHFVGVPCGILDQGVSGMGRCGHLVWIDCREPEFRTVPLPVGLAFVVFNTRSQHALVDGLYATRHGECMEAAKAIGVECLADATLADLESSRSGMSAAAHDRAQHVIEEIARVAQARAALESGDVAAAGACLTASHRSSQRLFGNSTPELDLLVDRLTTLPGVLGARLTGGGFGGAVMALVNAAFHEASAETALGEFADRFGRRPDMMRLGTGDGAGAVAMA